MPSAGMVTAPTMMPNACHAHSGHPWAKNAIAVPSDADDQSDRGDDAPAPHIGQPSADHHADADGRRW